MKHELRDLRGPCVFIHDVYVHESARRQGIGQKLLRAAIEWAHSREWRSRALEQMATMPRNVCREAGLPGDHTEMTLDEEASEH